MSVATSEDILYNGIIKHWYQPIINIETNVIIGYEALLRSHKHRRVSPVDFFDEAHKAGKRSEFDMLSIVSAVEQFKNEDLILFVNVFPSTLLRKDFISWWDSNICTKRPIVLELLETELIANWGAIRNVVNELRERDVSIAIDDMGYGYSFFQHWVELKPEYIKLDRYFASNLAGSIDKQKIIKCLKDFFSDTAEVIVEGVEREEDMEIIREIGVKYAQGYYLGRPQPPGNQALWRGT